MKCSLTVCSSTEGKEKEKNVGVGHSLYMGKTASLSGNTRERVKRRRKKEKGNWTKTRMQPKARGPFHLVEECG